MRGFDYRSEQGIHLLVARNFSSIRHKDQALTRVGRFGDLCERSRLAEVAPDMLKPHWRVQMYAQMNSIAKPEAVVPKPKPTVDAEPKAVVPKPTVNAEPTAVVPKPLLDQSERSFKSSMTIQSKWAGILNQAPVKRQNKKTEKKIDIPKNNIKDMI